MKNSIRILFLLLIVYQARAQTQVVDSTSEKFDPKSYLDTFNENLAGFYQWLDGKYSVQEPKEEYFVMESFPHYSLDKRFFRKVETVPYDNMQVYPVFTFRVVYYDNNEQLMSAVKLYLSSLSEDLGNGQKLDFGVDYPSVKTAPVMMCATQTELCIVSSKCEHIENNWAQLFDILQKALEPHIIWSMKIGCGGPIVWKTN